jgi:hypothetical protein
VSALVAVLTFHSHGVRLAATIAVISSAIYFGFRSSR